MLYSSMVPALYLASLVACPLARLTSNIYIGTTAADCILVSMWAGLLAKFVVSLYSSRQRTPTAMMHFS